MPCSALTRSATWICSSRLASSGCPEPPKARQVESVNCRPPPKPLPVLMAQFPLLSHSASASQSVSAWAAGAASSAAGMTGAPAATTARVARPSAAGTARRAVTSGGGGGQHGTNEVHGSPGAAPRPTCPGPSRGGADGARCRSLSGPCVAGSGGPSDRMAPGLRSAPLERTDASRLNPRRGHGAWLSAS